MKMYGHEVEVKYDGDDTIAYFSEGMRAWYDLYRSLANKIHHTLNGGYTDNVHVDFRRWYYSQNTLCGKAHCLKGDTFSEKTGKRIATEKLNDKVQGMFLHIYKFYLNLVQKEYDYDYKWLCDRVSKLK